MLKWPKKNPRQFAFAISFHKQAIHIAVLKASKETASSPQSNALYWRGRNWELIVNDDIDVENDNFASALLELLKRYERFSFKRQPLQIVLSSAFVEQVSVDKPELPEGDIAAALQWTLKELVDIPPADIVVDYYDLPIQTGSEKKIQAVVANRQFLQPILDVLHKEEFDIQGIVNADLAYSQWFDKDERVLALSQTQHDTNQLQIIVENRLILTRELSRIKPIRLIAPDDMDELEALALEMQRSIDFFTSQLRQAPLAEVALATTHPRASEIVDVIGAQLGMQSRVLNYPSWAQELKAGNYTDLVVLSGLLWLVAFSNKEGAS
ncbi:MAG: MSH system assembly platform protein MshIa [Idiomarinaceae bacterium HL-53]|nr:MAG: MSH system assembly platform protein MshIa [Idiomarinaceae bacterium HL-53]CUS47472.1 Tfp pilus assembly protein, ATPase PilM [Idiomarinaceae bacterium HL-53]